MNLLPKSHKEFGEKDYWNKFFRKRGNKAFEWYGEYLELCAHLHKYIKPTDAVLVPGCGNSSLSADLYDVGFKNLTNIDVSEIAIKQMQRINSHREKMSFICMDALQTSFEDCQFNVVLDKGTLDALMPDESEETVKRIDKYFLEIKRVLKVGGRFICVSLLQGHILKKFVEVFCDHSWMVRVVRCHEAEQKSLENGDGTALPVFILIATKFKKMPQLLLEVCMAGDKMVRISQPEELQKCIKSVQDTAFVVNGLTKTKLDENDEEVLLDLMLPGEDTPRYTLYIVDQPIGQTVNKYALFIVPQGRESEWLFGTPAGRKQLQKSAKFSRLVVVTLRRGQGFSSLDAVKEELAQAANMLTPPGFTGQIPFLSIGSDVGSRTLVHQGVSKCSGDFVVEDVAVEGDLRRRLVFLDNQMLVQSEARVKSVKQKNTTKTQINYGYISDYHAFMSVGVKLATTLNPQGKVAILGLGGGGLCMFLRKCLANLNLVAVDIDPTMLEIAKEYFGLILDNQMKVEIKDGVDFLKEEEGKGIKGTYEAILFDMDSKDRTQGLSCPPQKFLQPEVLAQVKSALTNNGHFILNLVCRDNDLQQSIKDELKKHFKHIVTMKLYEEVNEILFATNTDERYTPEILEAAVKGLNNVAREHKLVRVRCLDLKDFLQSVTVLS